LVTRKLVTKNENTFFSVPFEEALELLISQEKQETKRKQFCFTVTNLKIADHYCVF